MMTLEELAHLRRDLKLTQEQMAEELGLSRRAYIDIESGTAAFRKPHALAAERVALSYLANGKLTTDSYSVMAGDWLIRLVAEGKAASVRLAGG